MLENSLTDGVLYRFRDLDDRGNDVDSMLAVQKQFWSAVDSSAGFCASLRLNTNSKFKLGVVNPATNLLCLPEIRKGYLMPKSKKPKVKRPGANPVQKPGWYQALNGTAAQRGERPTKTGKKAQDKSA